MIDYNIIKKGSGVFNKNSNIKIQCSYCKCEFVVNGEYIKDNKDGYFVHIKCPDCGLSNITSIRELEVYEYPSIKTIENITQELENIKLTNITTQAKYEELLEECNKLRTNTKSVIEIYEKYLNVLKLVCFITVFTILIYIWLHIKSML